jgi:hypothetical protein
MEKIRENREKRIFVIIYVGYVDFTPFPRKYKFYASYRGFYENGKDPT